MHIHEVRGATNSDPRVGVIAALTERSQTRDLPDFVRVVPLT